MEVDIIGSLNSGVEVKFGSLICVVEIKSCPGTCRVLKLIIIGSLICVVEISNKVLPRLCGMEGHCLPVAHPAQCFLLTKP